MDANELRLLWRRFRAHTERPEHSQSLRAGQIKVAEDLLDWSQEKDPRTGLPPTNGYIVRPTGSGKTVSLIDFALGINCDAKSGDLKFDKRVLILTPTNVLNQQFAAELGIEKYRNPKKKYAYNAIPEDMVGLYDANKDKQVRDDALEKNFVIMTYDSFRKAVEEDRLDVKDFALTLLDEVHTKPRGDVTGAFLRRHVFNVSENGERLGEPPTLAIGATATHLYKTGNTIGDYLFSGADPVHLTPINQAVKEGEISGYRNVIVEPSFNEEARFEGDEKLSVTERRSILKQESRDTAAVRILKQGHDPITKKKYKDMKSVWYCRDVDHAKRLAARINEAMGVPNNFDGSPAENAYARAVSGKTPDGELNAVFINYKAGKHKALTNADLLIQGFDDEEAELCFMVHPTQSPTEVLQMGGRVLRKHKDKHHATIFTFIDPDQEYPAIFGELAGSYQTINGEEEFGPTAGQEDGGIGIEHEWPTELSDLNVHYLTRDIQQFAERRRAAQASDKKPSNMWTFEEMAKALGVKPSVMKRCIYEPLRGLFDQRRSRQQEIVLDSSATKDEGISINGQRFPIGTANFPQMGYFRTSANDNSFCLNEEAKSACRYALYGKLPQPKRYYFNQSSAARVIGVSDYIMGQLSRAVEEAYHSRNPYERTLTVAYNPGDGATRTVKMELNRDVVFCIAGDQPRLFLTAEGLRALYQLAHNTGTQAADTWWKRHSDKLTEIKTPRWLNKDEIMARLNIHGQHEGYAAFDKVWKQLERAAKTPSSAKAGIWADITSAMKRDEVSPTSQKSLNIDEHSLGALQELVSAQATLEGSHSGRASSRGQGWKLG